MRFILLSSACLALAGCDQVSKSQGNETQPADQAAPAVPELESNGVLDRSHAGSPMPTTVFRDPDGETVALDQIGDKPLLLNLWATWCAPCIAEMPTLDALAVREQGRIEVLAVSQDMEGRPKVDAFFAKRKFAALQPYLDREGNLAAELKVQSLPTTIFFGADGKERWRLVGSEDWRSVKAAKLLGE